MARVFGVNVSGFPAWWLWRTISLSKLPRLEKKVRVALDWTLDLIFSKDLVQFKTVHVVALERRGPTSFRSGSAGASERPDGRTTGEHTRTSLAGATHAH